MYHKRNQNSHAMILISYLNRTIEVLFGIYVIKKISAYACNCF